jgi:hypothetical protein
MEIEADMNNYKIYILFTIQLHDLRPGFVAKSTRLA